MLAACHFGPNVVFFEKIRELIAYSKTACGTS
jgi:hypothetical protein